MFSKAPQFQAPNPATEERIGQIIAQMTLEEKIDVIAGSKLPSEEQGGNTVPCMRVGIPTLKLADASVGIHWWTHESTTFPASIGLAATFNKDLAYRYGQAVGLECRSVGIHILLGPGVNIYRSALCGRNFEYLGEDPHLSSGMVVEYIKGVQDQGVAATVKHYAVNFQEYDRHHVSSDLDERTLREVYLPAFEAAVKDAGVAALMTAYNLVNSVHCAEHYHLIGEVLKGEWGFDGLVMSDWTSVYSSLHPAASGLDWEMPNAIWMTRERLVPAVRDGRLAESALDDKVRRILRLMFAFGWMDPSHKQKDESISQHNEAHAAVALDVARESVVLLKNEGILPLDRHKKQKIAVLGAMAHPAVVGGGGSAYNRPWRSTSILEGLQHLTGQGGGGAEIVYCRGIKPWNDDIVFGESEFFAPDGQRGVLAEYYPNNTLSGPPLLTRVEKQIDNRWYAQPIAEGIDKADFSIRYRGTIRVATTSEYILKIHSWDGAFRLIVDGAAVIDCWAGEVLGNREAQLNLTAGNHELVLEFRNVRKWNAIRLGYQALDAVMKESVAALAAAKDADAVIFCGGHDHMSEGEGADRTFAMLEPLEQLLRQVVKVNPNTVVVLTSGGNIDMTAWHDKVRAIVHAWYPGQEGGTAVAEVLLGLVNPSGKLPATFETKLEDRSSFNCYHDEDKDLRVELTDGIFGGYRHFDRHNIQPRYPFGFGLSYTTFAYEKLKLSTKTIKPGKPVTVSFDIVNTGQVAGKETAQVYVGANDSPIVRPVKELKGFVKAALEPGERKRVSVDIPAEACAHFDIVSNTWKIEPGVFTVTVSASAMDPRLTGKVNVRPGKAKRKKA